MRVLRSTRGRLTLTHAALLAAAVLLVDGALYLTVSRAELAAADDVLRAQAATISAGIEDVSGQIRFGGGDLPTETQQGVAVDAAIVTATGVQTETPSQPLEPADLAAVVAAARRSGGSVVVDITDVHGAPRRVFAEVLASGQNPAPVLVVSRSLSELNASIANLTLLMLALSLLVVVIGTVLAHRLAGRALEPVRRIATMARSISEHDLHRRVEVEVPPDELGELVATFNDMLARLEASFESLRRFTADASHELRTPLALMRAELDVALARKRDHGESRRVMRELHQEVLRMSRLVDRLLLLARADAGALRPALASVDVVDTLHAAAARWEPQAAKQGVTLQVIAPDTGTMRADADLISRVLDNLIDNAIRFTPKGGSVAVAGEHGPGGWRIEVHDGGGGVAGEVRPVLFQRFARAGAAGADGADGDGGGGGAGLGLALSRAIAEAHDGSLDLVENGSPGATFRLRLPDRL